MSLTNEARRRVNDAERARERANGHAVAGPASPDSVRLTCAADILPAKVDWLWPDWLAKGKLQLLAGPPGVAKTTIAMSIAATCTTGGTWPDGTRCDAGNVLIWSGEDDPADTLLPRLLAARAVQNRAFFVSGSTIDGRDTSFDPARDLGRLLEAVQGIGGVSLIVVDPVVNIVSGDSHKNTEVRRALQPLVELAASTGAALLGITHFAKAGQGSDPTQRVIGSVAFGALPRVVLVAAKARSKDGEPCRILARSKSNIGPDGDGFEYEVRPTTIEGGIQTIAIDWGKRVDGSARELLADPDQQDTGESNARDGAAEFLLEVLRIDVVPAKVIEAEARAAGISWRTVRRAADDLGVIKRKDGMSGGWYWSLPKMAKKNANLASLQEWTPSHSSVATFDPDARETDQTRHQREN